MHMCIYIYIYNTIYLHHPRAVSLSALRCQDPQNQMNQNFFITRFTPAISLSVTIFFLLSERALGADEQYLACNPKTCGYVQDIRFPFHIQNEQEPYCGYPGFNLSCSNNRAPILKLPNNDYIVHEIFYGSQSLRVSNAAVFGKGTTCFPVIKNISLADGRFRLSFHRPDLFLLFNCNTADPLMNDRDLLMKHKFDCIGWSETNPTLAMLGDNPLLGNVSRNCKRVVAAPVDLDRGGNDRIEGMLERGFMLNWTATNCSVCEASGGKCGFDIPSYQFRCFCPDRPHAWRCRDGKNRLKLPLGLGLGFGCLFIVIVLVGFYIVRHHYKRRQVSSNLLATNSSRDPSSRSGLQGGSICFGVPIFSYKELEEATNNFDSQKELGDGGFGTVYYGKLQDGREVAVKRLYQHNCRRVEQFMNEIEILTRLRHRNLVTLYGCTSRQSRELLLVYEYIPNGTVADHLHGDRSNSNMLTWPIRMSIAIETATALAYLHACDIVHRDVKTTNILLDGNFCVKVADFGLSKSFPNNVTHVSTAPQGTPGYVDPEYHQCYQLTDKSDVYSFGVVLIELISSMPAVDITRHRQEINLSNLAITKIKICAFDELIDVSLGYQSDKEVKRMATSVAELAFHCLQNDKEKRPSMEEVLQELKRIESGECKKNQEEVIDDKLSNSIAPPPSPPTGDEAALLNIGMPPSPDSVTNKWVSSSSTTTSNVSG